MANKIIHFFVGYSVALILFLLCSASKLSVLPLFLPVLIVLFYGFMKLCDLIQFQLDKHKISNRLVGVSVFIADIFAIIILMSTYSASKSSLFYYTAFVVSAFILLGLLIRFLIFFARKQISDMKARLPR